MGYGKRLLGDCLELMPQIPDGSVDMVITSPPYDKLRDYNKSLEWGEHIWKPIIQELLRIVKIGGVVVWIVGDATIGGSETGTSFKQALWAKECGFNLHDTMIWNKGTFTAVGALVSRYAPVFEYMFVFTKGKLSTFNPLKDRKNKGEGRKYHGTIRQADGSTKPLCNIGKEINEFGQRHNIWEVFAEKSNDKRFHPAMFPEQLIMDHIVSWSNDDDVILDPMAGSFTTAIACINTNRQYICIEKDPDYYKIGSDRIRNHLIKTGKLLDLRGK